ncbi:hypothetical protein [Streptomyces regalis]|uniref:hypothetical protein n=1 Tax=Streptomyces regalis TaxID=68262 RepID=UPI00099E63A9|nr:hypothetical protein [Streptomyces regalis]
MGGAAEFEDPGPAGRRRPGRGCGRHRGRACQDGSATCAFVLPSPVDGRPAHTADPLANDQDWHLVLWLRALLIHDIHPTSVAAIPEVLRTLTARGYHFVTVSHLRATL